MTEKEKVERSLKLLSYAKEYLKVSEAILNVALKDINDHTRPDDITMHHRARAWRSAALDAMDTLSYIGRDDNLF